MIAQLSGVLAVYAVARRAYLHHSLSYGGAMTAFFVGSIHTLAGWRYAVLLIFFFLTRFAFVLFLKLSTKLTKLWSYIKKQKEDKYTYGGEREAKQVIANSLVPTLICSYILFSRLGLIQISAERLRFLEGRCVCAICNVWVRCFFPQWLPITVNAAQTLGEVRWVSFLQLPISF